MRKVLLFNMLLALLIPHMQAQDLTVSGRVSSQEDGTGLPGVNIVVKGTTLGTTTDADGNYRISLVRPDVTLIFSKGWSLTFCTWYFCFKMIGAIRLVHLLEHLPKTHFVHKLKLSQPSQFRTEIGSGG